MADEPFDVLDAAERGLLTVDDGGLDCRARAGEEEREQRSSGGLLAQRVLAGQFSRLYLRAPAALSRAHTLPLRPHLAIDFTHLVLRAGVAGVAQWSFFWLKPCPRFAAPHRRAVHAPHARPHKRQELGHRSAEGMCCFPLAGPARWILRWAAKLQKRLSSNGCAPNLPLLFFCVSWVVCYASRLTAAVSEHVECCVIFSPFSATATV